MLSPFIDTILYTQVGLHPKQLNNDIYSNLKQNLIKKVEGQCYLNYGYITKVYEIIEKKNPHLITEDNSASTIFDIKFSCRLCHPLEKTQIICKINQITDTFISLQRDPIHIIIPIDRVNSTNFVKDSMSGKIKIKKTMDILESGTFVKTTIYNKTMANKDKRILAVGTLDDVTTESEVEQYYSSEYPVERKFVNYDEYVAKKP